MKKVLMYMLGLLLIVVCVERVALAQIAIAPAFQSDYTFTDYGRISGLPRPYGGLIFKAGDPNTLLIGGQANRPEGKLYSIGVIRGVDGHVTGFSDTLTVFAEAAYNDGGVTYGPGGIFF